MFSPLSAGNWNDTATAGVFYRNWNNNRSNDNNNNVGFRASDYAAIADLTLHITAKTGDIGMDLSCIMAKSAGRGFLVPTGKISHD